MKTILTALISAILASGFANQAIAADEGTLIVEQKGTQHFGEWGIGHSTGVIEGDEENYSSERPAGNFSITVSPPAGSVPTIEVYEDGTLKETFDSRTANGMLGSGGTLKFVLMYEFSRVGTVGVTSIPAGIAFDLKGPLETYSGVTPASYNEMAEGTYAVHYKPASPCPTPRPMARSLEDGGRIGFSIELTCEGATSSADSKDDEPKEKEEEQEETSSPPKLRVSLSSSSREVAAGATSRVSLVVANRGKGTLNDLTVDYRYDSSKIEATGGRGAQKQTNRMTWTIPSLAPGAKWSQSLGAKVKDSVSNGTNVSSTVTVSGDDLSGMPIRGRSASSEFGVMTIMPATGIGFALDAILLAAFSLASLALIGSREVYGFARR
ncbi:hypothetical protein HOF56_04350 [Candidatus Peribacteria bacterium]|nr:hypothetical protein [Candidatus Peribacteria bacterium]MBT4021640.1 hypothetical protein [Candidatus Peribacteria bacterium]MBT4241087.1 hypothetical protein [Candidatus Peribacteria bacterium]MBT4474414.1 hypothetical protein [Candidatus Peribacteria bacterium]